VEVDSWVATTWLASHALWSYCLTYLGFLFAASLRAQPPSFELVGAKVGSVGHPSGPTWPWLGPTCSSRLVDSHDDTLFDSLLNSPFGPLESSKLHSGLLKSIKH
jgi:hypothetical protein